LRSKQIVSGYRVGLGDAQRVSAGALAAEIPELAEVDALFREEPSSGVVARDARVVGGTAHEAGARRVRLVLRLEGDLALRAPDAYFTVTDAEGAVLFEGGADGEDVLVRELVVAAKVTSLRVLVEVGTKYREGRIALADDGAEVEYAFR
jgi:hypothetical protein